MLRNQQIQIQLFSLKNYTKILKKFKNIDLIFINSNCNFETHVNIFQKAVKFKKTAFKRPNV